MRPSCLQAKSARDGLTSQLEGNLLKQQEELQQKAAPAAAAGDTAALDAAQADLEAVVTQLAGLQQQVKDAEHKRDKADKEVGFRLEGERGGGARRTR
jgi:hypothetical protein